MARKKKKKVTTGDSGRLRIGDDWNAITIIALSQSNPLKAVAEFVENSIDAGARNVTITRGRERGEHYLSVADDGEGIPRDDEGIPNFRYVATHICDSLKRRLKSEGVAGIQGEFGIGLLSFWTVGEELSISSAGRDGKTYEMRMGKGDPGYEVSRRRVLFSDTGTELKVKPLLSGTRQLSGEKIQWYLASELRDRIRQTGVRIKVVDRHARKQFEVQPREFSGRLLHQLPVPRCGLGDVYLELYLAAPQAERKVGLHRAGTRVLENLVELEPFQRSPWTEGYLEGIVDAPFLNLTPGTRSGIIHDCAYSALLEAMEPAAEVLRDLIEEQRKAEEEHTSQKMLRTIQKAFREALMALPPEEYDWFDVRAGGSGGRNRPTAATEGISIAESVEGVLETEPAPSPQKAFFEFAGPLFRVRISPASCVVPVGESRTLHAVSRDRTRHLVEHNLSISWAIVEGAGTLSDAESEIATFTASPEPGLVRVRVMVSQGEVSCEGDALVTVTDSLLPEAKNPATAKQGLPGYTFEHAPGKLWRSRFDPEQNVIVINNGHRDFVYASRTRALKLRYIARLFAKELVCKNFPGHSPEELLERMVELSLYTEENLK